jgi:hypothetical protein
VTTLIDFINNSAELLISELPLESFNSSTQRIYAYVSDVGGWIPDDPLQPFGDGHLANNYTEAQVANDIKTQEYSAIYDLNFTVTVTLNVQGVSKLTSGLSNDSAATSLANQISTFLKNKINQSSLPIRLDTTSIQTYDVNNSVFGGNTTQTIRENIASSIANEATTKIVDYKALAVKYVRNTYGIDNTWNVLNIYTNANSPIVVMIRKYTDTTYSALDNTDTTTYVISISPNTYVVVGGVIIS